MDQLEKNSIEEFSKWADNYDNPFTSITFRQTNAKIVKILDPKQNSSLLDVGCVDQGFLLSTYLMQIEG